MKLIVSKTCPFAQRAWITAKAVGCDCDIEIIDLKNKPDWFLALTDFAKVPVLIDDQRRVLWESMVVANYLNELHGSPLTPKDRFTNAVNEAWISQVGAVMSAGGNVTRAQSQSELIEAMAVYQTLLTPLEKAVSKGSFFNGEQFCMIDVFYAPRFLRMSIVEQVLDIDLYKNLPKVKAWVTHVIEHPALKAATVDEFPELFKQNIGLLKQ